MSFRIQGESFRFEDESSSSSNGGNDDENSQDDSVSATATAIAATNARFQNMIQSYLNRLEDAPLVTKSITCALVSAFGALLSLPFHSPRIRSSSGIHHSLKNPESSSALTKASEVCAFAVYGGLVGGPLTHCWTKWLERHADILPQSTSWNILMDQLIAQPPMLFLMHLTLDMAGAAVREAPSAWNRSLERTGQSVVASWRFWPAAVYLILYMFKKRKEKITIAMNLCGIYWMNKIARQRSETLITTST